MGRSLGMSINPRLLQSTNSPKHEQLDGHLVREHCGPVHDVREQSNTIICTEINTNTVENISKKGAIALPRTRMAG